ncbi:helix-turn-helix transcriptional regulator [uncultured Streptococcus sp.]|uniref:helix-turn-helix domain-containing protein n=1 Tax=Streptococcus cristatus TaxID=45634 RepID=UPI0028D643DD|nr:helix-turn-helix transcriptional regulator [uncultured Streptococcus sp.]
MKISQVLKDIRQHHQLTQEALAERLNVSRSAIARWESGKGIPDIGNLIAISREFDLSLDQLIKEDERLEKKVIEDSKAKKWHYLVIFYLFSALVEIAIFAYLHHIFMAGFLISTLFMLFYELRIFIKEKIWRQKDN